MHSPPLALKLTPSQWATGWFFGIVALLFLAQSFLGGVLAHYRVEPGAFYGLDIARWHARRLTFLMSGTYHKLEWLRMVGDLVFLLAGALPITFGALRSVWKRDLPPTT